MKREEELITSDDNLAYNIGLEIRYAIAASGVDPIQHIPEVDVIIKRRIAEIRALANSPEAEPVAWRWVWKTTGSPLEQRFADPDLYSWTYRETPPSVEAAKKMVIEPLYSRPQKPDEGTLEPDAWMDEFGEVSTVKPAINPRPLYLHPPRQESTEGGAHGEEVQSFARAALTAKQTDGREG